MTNYNRDNPAVTIDKYIICPLSKRIESQPALPEKIRVEDQACKTAPGDP